MYLEILILAELSQRPMHGYEIKKEAEKKLGSIFRVNNNRLYPILKRFEKSGAVTKYTERQEGKPDRIIYSITSEGSAMLKAMILDFPEELASVNLEFYARAVSFGLIEKGDREKILDKRKQALTHIKARYESLANNSKNDSGKSFSYAPDVFGLFMMHTGYEIEWIDNFIPKL